jgi:hypothetical protein
MRKAYLLLAPVLGSAAVVACTSTTTSPVVACGPDDVAVVNAEAVAATNYEAGFYFGALDPIPVGFYTVADVSVGTAAAPQYGAPPTPPAPAPMAPIPTVTPTPVPLPTPAPTTPHVADAGTPPPAIVDAGTVAPVTDAGAGAPSTAAASAVAAAVDRNFPNGCATATASGNVVTFKLNNCTGPLGLLATSGTVTATLNVVGNAIHVQLSGNNVSTNGSTLNLATTGILTATASGQKTLQATSQTTGTGPGGNNIMRSATYTVVWPTGTGCATINGTLSGIGAGLFAGTTTQITNYVTCTNKCPQSGMTVSSFNGGSVTLLFNGTTNAQCTSSLGTSALLPLSCP